VHHRCSRMNPEELTACTAAKAKARGKAKTMAFAESSSVGRAHTAASADFLTQAERPKGLAVLEKGLDDMP